MDSVSEYTLDFTIGYLTFPLFFFRVTSRESPKDPAREPASRKYPPKLLARTLADSSC